MFKKIFILLSIFTTFCLFSTNVYGATSTVDGSASSSSSFDLNDPSTYGNVILNQIVTKTGQKEISSAPSIFNKAIKIFLGLSSAIFLIFLVIGGFKYLGSKGNVQEIGKSLSLIKTGIIGLAVILLAYSITQFIISQINNIGK